MDDESDHHPPSISSEMEAAGCEKKSEKSDSECEKPSNKFPKSVFFIVGNEFCERFSYYGMRAVLTLYFTTRLGMSDTTATIIYHVFVMLCYFTPILGAWLADSVLGKFRTILYLSLIYATGNIVLSVGSGLSKTNAMTGLSMCGLALIALGTGGIKPCVSAFGGDQFHSEQLKARETFFFIFYFSINAGSFISTFVTPILRSDVHCFGQDSCFPAAFGLPAGLMIASVVIFVFGKFLYRMVPPKGNIVAKVISCIIHAIGRKRKSQEKRHHWLEYADDKYDAIFISDVKAALRVMYLYIPLPVFWALYDQQGSTWTIQATEMNGRLGPNYVVLPDQMQVVNPFLILLLIPVFNALVYPLFAKCNLLTKSLTRIFIGGLLTAVAFYVAGFVQLKIEDNLPVLPSSGTADFSFVNTVNCSVQLQAPKFSRTLDKMQSWKYVGYPSDEDEFILQITSDCDLESTTQSMQLDDATAYTVVISSYFNSLNTSQMVQSRTKPDDGNGIARLSWALEDYYAGSVIKLRSKDDEYTFRPVNATDDTAAILFSEYQTMAPAYYNVFLPCHVNKTCQVPDLQLDIMSGGRYTVAIQADASFKYVNVISYQEVTANNVPMLWQIPQYVIITVGEIMFSITGLAFSYSQAPASMKSVLQAAWLLTDAFGNVIIIILEAIPMFKDQSSLFFLYASIMVVVMLIFAWMCTGYQYVTVDSQGNVHLPDDQTALSVKSGSVNSIETQSEHKRADNHT